MKYIISDQHFSHFGICDFDKRPFTNIEEMDETLIQNWNDVVKEEDTVYVLGDMFYRASSEKVFNVLDRLQGNIIYIFGNHERPIRKNDKVLKEYFVEHYDYLDIPYEYEGEDYRLVLSHYPIPHFNGHFRDNVVHFYGHVHNTEEENMTQYHQLMNFTNHNHEKAHLMLNVGSMMPYMNYTPQPLDFVIQQAIQRSKDMYNYLNHYSDGTLPRYKTFISDRKVKNGSTFSDDKTVKM